MGDPHRAHADLLLNAIDNLRGYRCAEQGPFLAHVDVTWRKAVEVTTQLEGAVEAIREAERLVSGALEPGAIGRPVREFTRGEMADLEMALASLRAVSDASPRVRAS